MYIETTCHILVTECHCDVTRSVNSTCHQLTGQCHCKEHVGGVKCDTCQLNHHTLSSVGCNCE